MRLIFPLFFLWNFEIVELAVEKEGVGCLDVRPSRWLMKRFMECGMEFQLDLMIGLERGEFPDLDTAIENIKEMLTCAHKALGYYAEERLSKLAIMDSYKSEAFIGDEEDLFVLGDIAEECTEELPNFITEFQIIVDTEICTLNRVAEECLMERNESLNTLFDASVLALGLLSENERCSAIQIPEYAKNIEKECQTSPGKDIEINTRNLDEDVRIAIRILMEEDAMKSTYCKFRKLGLESAEDCLNTSAVIATLGNFFEASDMPEIKSSLITRADDCAKKTFEILQLKPESDVDHFTPCMLFVSCFFPNFVQSCGLNNQLAKFFIPIMNEDVREALIRTLMRLKKLLGTKTLVRMFVKMIA